MRDRMGRISGRLLPLKPHSAFVDSGFGVWLTQGCSWDEGLCSSDSGAVVMTRSSNLICFVFFFWGGGGGGGRKLGD